MFEPIVWHLFLAPHVISNEYKVQDMSVMTKNLWVLPSKDRTLTYVHTNKQVNELNVSMYAVYKRHISKMNFWTKICKLKALKKGNSDDSKIIQSESY